LWYKKCLKWNKRTKSLIEINTEICALDKVMEFELFNSFRHEVVRLITSGPTPPNKAFIL